MTDPAGIMGPMPKRTVMLVDDSATVRLAAKARLEAAGFDVVESDGWAGVGLLVAKSSPDAAVVDLNMPGLDGEVLIDLMRRYWPWLPLLVMTAEEEPRVRAIRARGLRVLPKSEASGIAEAVRALLEAR